MKKLTILAMLFFLTATAVYSQNAANTIRQLANRQDYVEAAKLIPESIRENPRNADLFVLYGDIYYELLNLDSTVIMYRKANELESNKPNIIRKLSNALSEVGQHEEAIDLMRRVLRRHQDDVANHLQLGYALIKADSIKQAELVITRAREMDRRNPQTFIVLGDLYFAQKVYELARSNYEEALSLDENFTQARINLATSYYWLATQQIDQDLRSGLFNRSLEEWQKVTQKDPRNARAFYEAGRIYFFARYYAEAAPFLYQYVQLRPQGSLGRWYLAQSIMEIGNCDSAIVQLKMVAEELDSVKTKARLMLGECYYRVQDYPNAISYFNLAKKDTTLEAKEYELLAISYLRSEDTTSAIEVYKNVVKLDPERCATLLAFGTISFAIKDYDNAVYFLNTRMENCDDELSSRVLYYIGMSYLFNDIADSAILALRRATEIDPEYWTAFVYMGDAYAKMDLKDSAKAIYSQITTQVEVNEDNERIVETAFQKLCGLYFEERNFRELQKIAKSWTEATPKSAIAFLYYAISYQGLQDLENACRNFRRVLQIDPQNQTARNSINQLKCN